MKSFKSFLEERCWPGHKPVPGKKPYSPGSCVKEEVELDEASPAWQRKEGKNPEGGLNRKGIASYRRENPGSKLSSRPHAANLSALVWVVCQVL